MGWKKPAGNLHWGDRGVGGWGRVRGGGWAGGAAGLREASGAKAATHCRHTHSVSLGQQPLGLVAPLGASSGSPLKTPWSGGRSRPPSRYRSSPGRSSSTSSGWCSWGGRAGGWGNRSGQGRGSRIEDAGGVVRVRAWGEGQRRGCSAFVHLQCATRGRSPIRQRLRARMEAKGLVLAPILALLGKARARHPRHGVLLLCARSVLLAQ